MSRDGKTAVNGRGRAACSVGHSGSAWCAEAAVELIHVADPAFRECLSDPHVTCRSTEETSRPQSRTNVMRCGMAALRPSRAVGPEVLQLTDESVMPSIGVTRHEVRRCGTEGGVSHVC
jgi:hypothetical protein